MLRNLRASRLHKNQLSELPDTIGQLQKLEQLSLYENKLKKLPASFALLQNMDRLNLAQNEFELFPVEIKKLHRLSWLAFFENPLLLEDPPMPFSGSFLGIRPFHARTDTQLQAKRQAEFG